MPTLPLADKSWNDRFASGRPFLKMHGLENHFVIVDGRSDPFRPDAEAVRRLCDPRRGVGADQLVIVEAPDSDEKSSGAAARVRFWNADGGEAEACGNASRCVAWLLLEEAETGDVLLATRGGLLHCRRAGTATVSVRMGRIRTAWRDIPLSAPRDTCHLGIGEGPLQDPVALNVGNPHAVFFVANLDTIDLAAVAPAIQANPLFPAGVNVGAAEIVADDRLKLRVFERGAGLTMACGSGACAAAFAALSRGLTDSRTMAVELPGGELTIEIEPDGAAMMTGPVELSFSGRLPVGTRDRD